MKSWLPRLVFDRIFRQHFSQRLHRKLTWVTPIHTGHFDDFAWVGQLAQGGCLELATAYHRVAQQLPRDNH